ncbi:mycofactocin system transcriptional regulator [Microbacterium karelineae]|uniref:mycofactocin system transcriptional regulator n=1 Tax=Microbacterium karelineae TaxID=2654283 RepID=UPI0012EACF3F|nr:mycofactocin system transcriptional regulator [Microbacterium karelineae]
MSADANRTAGRVGRASATSRDELGRIGLELMLERGFEAVTVDDIAAAAGIGRRTFFRYFRSKSDVPWGDFDALLRRMRERFAEIPDDVPLAGALRETVVAFNDFPAETLPDHRRRMRLLLETPTLVAYSALQYAEWRQTIAEFVAARRGEHPSSIAAQTSGRVCLAISLAAYEAWLADESLVLTALIAEGFDRVGETFGAGLFARSAAP